MSWESEFEPESEEDLVGLITDAGQQGVKVAIEGLGSKAELGAPQDAAWKVTTHKFNEIVDYDPGELVLTVGSGVTISEINALLEANNQFLAFDALNYGNLSDNTESDATIGGVITTGGSGSRRLTQGAVRDHVLGFTAVSGRAERFQAGGRVVKNVTGYDLSKLMTGSWGRLACLTEVTLRTLPAPAHNTTLVVQELSPKEAQQALSASLGRATCLSTAAYLPGSEGEGSITLWRLEGFEAALEAGRKILTDCLSVFGQASVLPSTAANALWARVKTLPDLRNKNVLWRVNTPPSLASEFVAGLAAEDEWIWDWAAGLTWVGTNDPGQNIRRLAEGAKGHAMLVRAPQEMRGSVPFLHPQPAVLRDLEARIRRGFDPLEVFETGRFLGSAS